jgi:hypothetical protein
MAVPTLFGPTVVKMVRPGSSTTAAMSFGTGPPE